MKIKFISQIFNISSSNGFNNILIKFDNYQVNSVDGVDIKWDLFNEHFIEYYNQVLIYIDNR